MPAIQSEREELGNTITTPEDIPFLIEQISKCLSLAEICGDRDIEALLFKLARKFAQRALVLGAERVALPKIPGLVDQIDPAADPTR